jgi:hypothetical protein
MLVPEAMASWRRGHSTTDAGGGGGGGWALFGSEVSD